MSTPESAGYGTREPCPIHKPMPCTEDCPNSPETHAQRAKAEELARAWDDGWNEGYAAGLAHSIVPNGIEQSIAELTTYGPEGCM